MISDNIKKECIRIDAWEKTNKKFVNPAIIIALIATGGMGYFLEQVPDEESVVDNPDQSIPAAIFAGIGYPISLALYYKGKKLKISGYELSALRIYRAFTKLSDYKNDNMSSTLNKAHSQMRKLILESPSYFGRESKAKPPFSFLESHKEVYKKIVTQLMPAIKNAKTDQVEQIQQTLSILIECFFAKHIDNLQLINDELNKYSVKTTKEVSIGEFFRTNKIARISLMIISSITIGGFATLLASLGGGDQQTLIMIWGSMTGVSAVIFFTKYK